jgi:hypothetical protein
LSSTVAAWIAIGAAALAALGLALAVAFFLRLRDVRAAQRTLLAGGTADLIDFAVSLQGRIDDLHRSVDDLTGALAGLERRLDGAVARLAVVRYNAYENTGGHQSASVALLDESRSGVVLSAIQGREHARIYVKELDRGRSALSLSPEEQEAVDRAMRAD